MSRLTIIIMCMLTGSCLVTTLPRWSDDEVYPTKQPDPWVITTVGQPSPHQQTQPPVERPPVLQGGFTQGQWEYIKGLLQGWKSTIQTHFYGSAFGEHIPDGPGIHSDYTQIKGYVCVGYKACPEDRRFYLEFDSVSWVKRPCPYGYTFDDSSCYCTAQPQLSTTLASPSNTVKVIQTTPVPESTAPSSTSTTPTTQTTTSTITATTSTTQIPTTTQDTTTSISTPSTTVATTTQEPISSTEIATVANTTPDSQVCSSTVILNSSGFTRLPGSCDIFVQCRFVGDVPSPANSRRCPSGLLWNQEKLTCDYARNVKCESDPGCYNKQAVPENKGEYLMLTKDGWVVSLCPDGMGYNQTTCSCSDKFVFEHLHPHCPDKIPISDDPRGFLEYDGVTWMYVPCPDTLLYDQSSCTCALPQADPYLDSEHLK